mmetsp:Transcript_26339/g.43452  ORF Transcript_26339/g.43452 Transcript_26339/m.43452 type:complete len:96 (+) Transcript_26339:2042-2329(+)
MLQRYFGKSPNTRPPRPSQNKTQEQFVTVSSQTSVLRAAAGFSLVNLSFESADLELEVEDESSHAKHRGHHVTTQVIRLQASLTTLHQPSPGAIA